MILEFYESIIDFAWVLEIILMALSWVLLCGRERKIKTLILHTIGLSATLGVANMVLYILLGGISNFFIYVWSILHGAIAALYCKTFSYSRRRLWVLIWLALYNSLFSIGALAGQCSVIFGTYVKSGPVEGVVRCIVYFLMPFTALWLRKFKFEEISIVPRSGIVLVGTMCVCINILSIVEAIFFKAGVAVIFVYLAVYACMTISSLASVKALYAICQEQKDISELLGERQRYLAEKEITKIAANTLEDLHCIKHDLNNQFSYLQILLDEEKYDELKEYFSSLKEHLPEQLKLIECGNRTINTVLNMEFSKFRSKEVEFEHQLVVPPVLPFKDGDICAILSNLLDNALEECIRLRKKGIEETKVRLEIYPHQSYLYIRCKNSTDREEIVRKEQGILTTKSDKQMHGYGTRIVSKTSQKYNGCADFTLESGMFVATVMLDMVGRNMK